MGLLLGAPLFDSGIKFNVLVAKVPIVNYVGLKEVVALT
jgi:hypothetical protein